MKFWQKTFLCVLTIFLIAFDFGAFSLLHKSYELNEETETARAVSQFESIGKTLDYMLSTYDQTGPDLTKFIQTFSKTYLDEKLLMEVYDGGGQRLFSNAFDLAQPRSELTESSVQTVYRKVNGRLYLFTGGTLKGSGLRMVIAYDVNYLREYSNKLLRYFIILSSTLSLLLSALLIVLIRRLTAPLRQLGAAAQEIAQGAYDKRVSVCGKDEIGEFAANFNLMADAVSSNIVQQETFINHLTHELKTSITALRGYSAVLQKDSITQEQRQMAENYILDHTNRLNILSGKLMELLYLKNDAFRPSSVSVSMLFSSVENLAQLYLSEKAVNLQTYCPSPSLAVLGDEALLQTLLINLLENSIKASQSGGTVVLRACAQDDHVVLEMEDHGVGIAQEKLDKITDAFYTVDPVQSKATGGIGLGLSICKLVAQLHGSKLEIESQPGQGTKISLALQSS